MKTTEQILENATSKIAKDISGLGTRRNNAINVFRQTANELASINEDLDKSLANLNKLQEFIVEQSKTTTQMISDNNGVRERILAIIGE